MTVSQWLESAGSALTNARIGSSRLEAQVLLAHSIGADRTWILAHPEAILTEVDKSNSLLERRCSHEPLAYILGWREFYGRRFAVRPGALIPRQETETLVELALDKCPDARSILDLGAGSGCLGITLDLEKPQAQVIASDLSLEALSIAWENREVLRSSVQLVRADGLTAFRAHAFDLIVSNPPYIGELEVVMAEARDHEPAIALFADEGGMRMYRHIAAHAAGCLKQTGRLIVEVGDHKSGEVADLFEDHGWGLVERRRDLLGIERALMFAPA